MSMIEDIDTANAKLSQARALSFMLYAESGDAFRGLNDRTQDAVMWLLADTLNEGVEAYNRVARAYAAEQEKARVASAG